MLAVTYTEGEKFIIEFCFLRFHHFSPWKKLYCFFCRYVVLGEEPIIETNKFTSSRPVWFIYSGMGCQWTAMGRDLMKFNIFKNTFHRCAEVLKPYDVNLYDIVTSKDPTIFDDVLHSFTAICAIQVALTDLLHALGIFPDGIGGFSMGEIGK